MNQFNDPVLLSVFASLLLFGAMIGSLITSIRVKKIAQQTAEQHRLFAIQQETQLRKQLAQQELIIKTKDSELQFAHEEQMSNQNKLGRLTQRIERIAELEIEKHYWQQQYQQSSKLAGEIRTQLESQAARFEQEQIASKDKLILLEVAEKRLQEKFENIANKIFEQKQEKFSQSSKAGLDSILSPLKEQIEGFKKQVTDQYVKEGQERASLKTEILGLKELNQQMSKETLNLTKALKGDNKIQGNWGELVLERVLEKSGLEKDREYFVQQSFTNEEGRRILPDVVIHLPDNKKMIVDSKVSLVAYEQYINEEDETLKERFLKEHVASLKRHVEQLSDKKYEDIYKIESPDFVLLFIPIEPAFAIALNSDTYLYNKAFEKNIIIVTPSTLLATLRTIDTMWNNEKQQRNALEIARQAGALYDKFQGFLIDLIGIGKRIDESKKEYSNAMNKLVEGRGNIITSVEKLKKMGAKAKKSLPEKIIERAREED